MLCEPQPTVKGLLKTVSSQRLAPVPPLYKPVSYEWPNALIFQTFMYIINIRCLIGPNYWSIEHPKLVIMTLDLERLQDYPTNKINGFYNRLSETILYHQPGSDGLNEEVPVLIKEGISLARVVEQIALKIQQLAGINVSFGQTNTTDRPEIHQVVFAYEDEQAGKRAASDAVAIVEALVNGCQIDVIQRVAEIRRLYETNQSPGFR